VLRKVESVYNPPAICTLSSTDSKIDPGSSEASQIEDSPSKAHPVANTSQEGVKQAKGTAEAGNVNKEADQAFDLPLMALKDLSKDKETSHNMELVLATLSIPPKEDPKEAKMSTLTTNT